jgi:hypothetical protein
MYVLSVLVGVRTAYKPSERQKMSPSLWIRSIIDRLRGRDFIVSAVTEVTWPEGWETTLKGCGVVTHMRHKVCGTVIPLPAKPVVQQRDNETAAQMMRRYHELPEPELICPTCED